MIKQIGLYSFFIFILILKAEAASTYSLQDQFLGKTWPISLNPQTECYIQGPKYWREKAENIISLDPLQEYFDLNSDEVMVVRNLLISQAYNRLFTYSLRLQNTERSSLRFYWIAAGSQASVTVGHALQAGLTHKYSKNSRQGEIFNRLDKLHAPLPVIPTLLLSTIKEVKRKTAENNWRVFSDIFWQHLAYLTCGLDEVVRLNTILVNENYARGSFDEVDHFERFIDVWKDMDAGLYFEANMKLIYIEQFIILQRYMYNSLDANVANALLIFNRLAKADLLGTNGKEIKDFGKYSIENGDYPNLGHFPTRFKWMKYVVSEQAAYLNELATPEKIEKVLTKSLFESYQVIRDYDDLKN